MKEKLHDRLPHLVLSFLETAGLLLPLLGLLGIAEHSVPALLTAAGILVLSELCRLNRKTAVLLPAAFVTAALIWLTAGGGIAAVKDILLGATLHLNGIPASLTLVGSQASVLLAVLLSLLVFWVSVPEFGGILLFLLSLMMFVLIWYFDRFDLLPLFIPAIAASVIHVIRFSVPEMSVFRLLPWVAAVAVAAVLLTPPEGVTVAPMKDAADELRRSVTDTFFFTDPRNVFSLADEGFYPQGRNQLGGKVEFSDLPVMEVAATEKLWLRGVTMDGYTGRSWVNSTGGRRYLWTARSWLNYRSKVFNMDLPASGSFRNAFTPVDFSVRILSGSASTLFVPQRITDLRPGGNMIPYYNASSEIFITRDLQPGDTYSGTAYNYLSGTPGLSNLIDACALSADPDLPEIIRTYTALPEHLEQRVRDLALTASGNAVSPYEKAFTIQNWLSRSFRYTTDVADQPEDIDFVTNFLFNTKEGYCTYFASAMTVLCRMIGLPARYVEGYLVRPGVSGTVTVTGRDAHAWTEVYFSGFGWVTFDATPAAAGNNGPETSGPTPEPTVSPAPTSSPTPTPSPEPHDPSGSGENNTPTPSPHTPENDPKPSDVPADNPNSGENSQEPDSAGSSGSIPWLLIVLLAAAAVLLYRIRSTDPAVRARKASGEYNVWMIWTQDLFDTLHAAGMQMRPAETPMSFTRRLDTEGTFSTSTATAGECISLICYGHVSPIGTDSGLMRDTALSCRHELTGPAKVRYFFRRIFIPMSRRRFDGFTVTSGKGG